MSRSRFKESEGKRSPGTQPETKPPIGLYPSLTCPLLDWKCIACKTISKTLKTFSFATLAVDLFLSIHKAYTSICMGDERGPKRNFTNLIPINLPI